MQSRSLFVEGHSSMAHLVRQTVFPAQHANCTVGKAPRITLSACCSCSSLLTFLMNMPFQLIVVTLSLSRMQDTKGNVQARIHSRQRSSVTTLQGNVFIEVAQIKEPMHNDNCFRHDFLACGPLQAELLYSHILGQEQYMLASICDDIRSRHSWTCIPNFRLQSYAAKTLLKSNEKMLWSAWWVMKVGMSCASIFFPIARKKTENS